MGFLARQQLVAGDRLGTAQRADRPTGADLPDAQHGQQLGQVLGSDGHAVRLGAAD